VKYNINSKEEKMKTSSMPSLQHTLSCFLAMSAAIVLSPAFVSVAKADTFEKNCTRLATSQNLTDRVHVKILKWADWEQLTSKVGLKGHEVSQIQVRTLNGHQYLVASEHDAVYKCDNTKLDLDVKLLSIESETKLVSRVNPCCTVTSGSEAMAKWYSYASCPVSRPMQLNDSVCGH